jgi:hypothetical protein
MIHPQNLPLFFFAARKKKMPRIDSRLLRHTCTSSLQIKSRREYFSAAHSDC